MHGPERDNWPYDQELGLYYKPDGWAIPSFRFDAEYDQLNDIIEWLNNHKKSIWWTVHSNMLYLTFRKQKDYTMFMLKWGN